jgi:hypothetical protein
LAHEAAQVLQLGRMRAPVRGCRDALARLLDASAAFCALRIVPAHIVTEMGTRTLPRLRRGTSTNANGETHTLHLTADALASLMPSPLHLAVGLSKPQLPPERPQPALVVRDRHTVITATLQAPRALRRVAGIEGVEHPLATVAKESPIRAGCIGVGIEGPEPRQSIDADPGQALLVLQAAEVLGSASPSSRTCPTAIASRPLEGRTPKTSSCADASTLGSSTTSILVDVAGCWK